MPNTHNITNFRELIDQCNRVEKEQIQISHSKMKKDMELIILKMSLSEESKAIIEAYTELVNKSQYSEALLYLCKNYNPHFYSLVESLLWYQPYLNFKLSTAEIVQGIEYTAIHYAVQQDQLALAYLLFFCDSGADFRKLAMRVVKGNIKETDTIEHYLKTLIQGESINIDLSYRHKESELLRELEQLPKRVDPQYKDQDVLRLELIIRVLTFIKNDKPVYNGVVPEIFNIISTFATRNLFANALIAMVDLSRPLQAHFLPHLRFEWTLIEQVAGIIKVSVDNAPTITKANLLLAWRTMTNPTTNNQSENILKLVIRRGANERLLFAALPDLLKDIDALLTLTKAMLDHAKKTPEEEERNITHISPIIPHNSLCHMRALVTQAATINFLGMLHLITKTENTTIQSDTMNPANLSRQISSDLTDFSSYGSRLAFLDRLIRLGELATKRNHVPMPLDIRRLLLIIRNTLVHVDQGANAFKVKVLLCHMSEAHYKTLFNELDDLFQILISCINEINMGVEYNGVMSEYWHRLVDEQNALDAKTENHASKEQAVQRLNYLIMAFERTLASLRAELEELTIEINKLQSQLQLQAPLTSVESFSENDEGVFSLGCSFIDDHEQDVTERQIKQKTKQKTKLEVIINSIQLDAHDREYLEHISNGLAWDTEKRNKFHQKIRGLKNIDTRKYNDISSLLEKLGKDTRPPRDFSVVGLKHFRALGQYLSTNVQSSLSAHDAYLLLINSLDHIKESLGFQKNKIHNAQHASKLIAALNSNRCFSSCFTQYLNWITLVTEIIKPSLPTSYEIVCTIIRESRNIIIHGRTDIVLDSCAASTRDDTYKVLSQDQMAKLLVSLRILFEELSSPRMKAKFTSTPCTDTTDLELMLKSTLDRLMSNAIQNEDSILPSGIAMTPPIGFFTPGNTPSLEEEEEEKEDYKTHI